MSAPVPELDATTTQLPVAHLFTLDGNPAEPAVVNKGPRGTRNVYNVTEGRFQGARLSGDVVPPSGDWSYVREDGSLRLDVRLTLRTTDEAIIYAEYGGIIIFPDKIHAAPLFETGDPRYSWLNTVQAIGIGRVNPGATLSLTYEFYELA